MEYITLHKGVRHKSKPEMFFSKQRAKKSPSITTRTHSLIMTQEEPEYESGDEVVFRNTDHNSRVEPLSANHTEPEKKNFSRFVTFLESVEVIGYVETDAESEYESAPEQELVDSSRQPIPNRMSSMSIMSGLSDLSMDSPTHSNGLMNDFMNDDAYSEYFAAPNPEAHLTPRPLTPDNKENNFINKRKSVSVNYGNILSISTATNNTTNTTNQMSPTQFKHAIDQLSSPIATKSPMSNLLPVHTFNNIQPSNLSSTLSVIPPEPINEPTSLTTLSEVPPVVPTKSVTPLMVEPIILAINKPVMVSSESQGETDPLLQKLQTLEPKLKQKKKIRHVQIQVRIPQKEASMQTEDLSSTIIDNEQLKQQEQERVLANDTLESHLIIIEKINTDLYHEKQSNLQLSQEKEAEVAHGILLSGLIDEMSAERKHEQEIKVGMENELRVKEDLMNKAYLQMKRLLLEKEAMHLQLDYMNAIYHAHLT